MALLLGAYIAFRDGAVLRGLPHATWHGWSRDALRGWRAYLRCPGLGEGVPVRGCGLALPAGWPFLQALAAQRAEGVRPSLCA